MKRLILLCLCLGIVSVFAQNQSNPDWNTYLEGYSVVDIADAGNYLWFTNYKEVYRFEKLTGNTTHFAFEDMELSRDYSIPTIICDNNGLPWIGVEFTGTLKMTEEGKWFLLPQVSTDAFERGTHEILVTENGAVWTSTINILTRYKENNVESYTTNGSIISLAEDAEGSIWIGTANYFHGHYDGLVKYDGKNWTIYNSSMTGSIPLAFSSIAIDKHGALWMGGYEGIDHPYTDLVEFDGTSWIVYYAPFHNHPFYIREIAIDEVGTKWLATNHGLMTFDGSDWTTYNVLNSELPSDNVYSIIIDSNGTKWLGTANGLVTITNKSAEKNLTTSLISESGLNHIFKLYPNPVNDFIVIKMPKEIQYSHLKILNIQGKIIKSFTVHNNQNQLDVSDLSNGIYFVRIQTDKGCLIKKIVKQ
ncbi:T9SS type A sorting domain-containing protein [Saccharicrinis sp. FJH2]|uniref:T9SS type A sorting domain-containing protein n=1 Tax=Saccharicrinis sp. FJH65 TaxID=3344659 RepID=UPI0035F372E7